MSNTTTPEQQDRYAEIVQAAIRAFARKGYGGTTLADIAVEAGVSQPRISQIFGTKENAFVEAHRSAAEEVLTLLTTNAEPPYEPSKLGAGYASILQRRPEVLLMIFQALTSSYVPSIGADARRVINDIAELVVNRAGGSPEDAVQFLERGFFIHAMLASGAFEHAAENPATGQMLESVSLH